ncbi:alanine racemase [Sphingomonas sp. XXL09]|uniref:alanine racemase n=1 Tax=Sphingomonas sp. XXL09 TaxID=3457787 RepID=UPI00406BB4B9
MTAPLRLRLDLAALADNWRSLARMSGRASCGAAIKANGYGLGAETVARRLADVGCRDFFVATWAEAERLAPLGLPNVSVLHGIRDEDMTLARAGVARPVLNTPAQMARWRECGGGACDVMVDTGINRLGIAPDSVVGLADGLRIETLMSHLACADEDHPLNAEQCAAFTALRGGTGAVRMSLANSAGIALGSAYHFDLTRPGLALYGGEPRHEFAGVIRQVVFPEAQILQRRTVRAGDTVGYNATWSARRDTEVAILNLGYADGYRRAFSNCGSAGSGKLPVIGRVSMDLLAIDVSMASDLVEGDWVTMDYALPAAAEASGVSQYELLTGLGRRFQRP